MFVNRSYSARSPRFLGIWIRFAKKMSHALAFIILRAINCIWC